ncbi:DUF928 domain-containing protein [Oscillatoriales cyanobacterium LEGE 11467]|uniref:DUF928 domain-containing protein n=1 Tax=Zarconia navalis LEGE 11467 TaxID=1828826 RepID=A0A928VZE2_9CYAN|nr:DUF928 domain-containing protein [Zarconia navalis]MBE9042434.1 DUF928 domain-containing protein [Zarconia navalis LEGE 11467]
MTQSNFPISLAAISATFAGAVLLSTGFVVPARASATLDRNSTLPKGWPVSVEFQTPGEAAPPTSIGGGVRGSVQFAAPGNDAPVSSVAGGTRGNVQFAAPGNDAPVSSVAGGTRGNVQFENTGDSIPDSSVAGGTRGNIQFENTGDSIPDSSVAGGTRGNELPTLTALLPPTQHGQTRLARPTFYVYIPPTASKQVFFSIQDEDGNPLYHTMLNISGEGGTVGVTLPENSPELEVGKNYLWALAPIEPNGILRPDNLSVVGWVKRVETFIPTENTSDPVELATEYGASGLWYETLEILAKAQLDRPGDETLRSEWNDLLEQVGLESVAIQPILN